MESSSHNDDDLRGAVATLSVTVNQLSAMMVQMQAQLQESLERIETRLTNLETNWREDNHQNDGRHIRNQRERATCSEC